MKIKKLEWKQERWDRLELVMGGYLAGQRVALVGAGTEHESPWYSFGHRMLSGDFDDGGDARDIEQAKELCQQQRGGRMSAYGNNHEDRAKLDYTHRAHGVNEDPPARDLEQKIADDDVFHDALSDAIGDPKFRSQLQEALVDWQFHKRSPAVEILDNDLTHLGRIFALKLADEIGRYD